MGRREEGGKSEGGIWEGGRKVERVREGYGKEGGRWKE